MRRGTAGKNSAGRWASRTARLEARRRVLTPSPTLTRAGSIGFAAGSSAWYARSRATFPGEAIAILIGSSFPRPCWCKPRSRPSCPYFERFLERFPTLCGPGGGGGGRGAQGVGGPGILSEGPAAARGREAGRGGRTTGRFPTIPRPFARCPAWVATSPGRFSPSHSTVPPRSSRRTPSAVLARWLAWRGDLNASSTRARLWQAAERLVPAKGREC